MRAIATDGAAAWSHRERGGKMIDGVEATKRAV